MEPTYVWKSIEFFAFIGQAYDLKTVSQDMIKQRVLRTGDGTHPYSQLKLKNKNFVPAEKSVATEHIWGWDDRDITENDINLTIIHNRIVK
jgi:stearoyl-CoA desaturase (delta-9 desaturase)